MTLYRNILKQGLKITWHNRYLWFFGLFAALLGNGGEYEILSRNSGRGLEEGGQSIYETGIFSVKTLGNIGRLFRDDPGAMLLVLAVSLIILFMVGFLIWVVIVSQGALVDSSARIISKKGSQNPGIKNDFKVGVKNFWPVFGLNIIIKAAVILAFWLIGAALLAANFQLANGLFIILFIILIPVAIAFSFMIKYAICYAVIKENSFLESIAEGWRLFAANWLVSIEMAFILFFLNFAFGLALILIVLTLTIPFLFLAFVLYQLISLAGFWFMFITALVLFLAIIMAGGAMLATFQTASWTGLFVELVSKGGESKIKRVVEEWRK